MAVSYLIDVVSKTIKEELDTRVREFLPKVDSIFDEIKDSSIGVSRDAIGRDWRVKKTFRSGLAGCEYWCDPSSQTYTLDGGQGANGFSVMGTGVLETFPDITEMGTPGYMQMGIRLKKSKGNFFIPMDLMKIDALDASFGQQVQSIMDGVAERHALDRVHQFWKLDTAGKIGTFTSDGTTLSYSAGVCTGQTITLTSGRIAAFRVGQQVSLVNITAGGTTVLNGGATPFPVWVDSVDYLQKKMVLKTTGGSAGTGTVTLTNTNNIGIYPYKSGYYNSAWYTYGPSSLMDWMKTSGYLFGSVPGTPATEAINLTNYPEFRSIINTSLSGALTGDILNKHIAPAIESARMSLDTMVTTNGTLMGMLSNVEDPSNFLINYERTGKAANVEMGWQKIGYRFGDKTFRLLTSPYCPDGNLFILKLGDGNIKRFVPPRLPNSGSRNDVGAELEFLAPLAGSKTIFTGVNAATTAAFTTAVQAPYQAYCEYLPTDPRGIQLATFSENFYVG